MSTAPEGATHYLPPKEGFRDSVYYRTPSVHGVSWWDGSQWEPCAYLPEAAIPIKRDEPVAWDGQGWPPVGTKCEMRLWPDGEWEPCQPAYYLEPPIDHSDQVVVYQNSLGGDVCYILDPPCAGSIEFRPIRTAEQIAAEEREKAARDLHDVMFPYGGWEAIQPMAKDAYLRAIDAGYRKQEAAQ